MRYCYLCYSDCEVLIPAVTSASDIGFSPQWSLTCEPRRSLRHSEGFRMPLKEVKEATVMSWFSSFLYFHVRTEIRSKGNERQAIKMCSCRGEKIGTTLENDSMPTRLSSVSPMIQRGDKNPFKVQHRSLFWKAECYFQEWGNGNTDIGQGIQCLYWAWVIVAHSFTSEVENHKLGFKIITNTALMPTGCAFNPGAESLKNTNHPVKNKSQRRPFNATFTTRKQKCKDLALCTLLQYSSTRQTFIKSCYEPGTVLTSTTVIYGVLATCWMKLFDGLSFSSYNIILWNENYYYPLFYTRGDWSWWQ